MTDFTACLPFPPSLNHYWRHGSKGTYISAEGKAYRAAVLRLLRSQSRQFSQKTPPEKHRCGEGLLAEGRKAQE